jgi:hypothetical protein
MPTDRPAPEAPPASPLSDERLRSARDELQSLLDIPPRPRRRPYLQGLHGRAVVERAIIAIGAALAEVDRLRALTRRNDA